MRTVTLHEALSLIVGRPRETAMAAFGRNIRHQNEIKKLVQACVGELERSGRYHWLLCSFTLEHVTNVGPRRRALQKFWPPQEIIACLDRRRRNWPTCVDVVRTRAAEIDRDWEDYRLGHTAAREQLTLAVRDGSLRLYYRDDGTSGLILIPSALLHAPITIRPFEENLLILIPPGELQRTGLAASQEARRFRNVRANLDDVNQIVQNLAAAPPLAIASPSKMCPASDDDILVWYRKRRHDEGHRATREDDILACKAQFSGVRDARGTIAELRRSLEFKVARGRPKKTP